MGHHPFNEASLNPGKFFKPPTGQDCLHRHRLFGMLDQNIDINAIPLINGYVAWNHFWMEEKLSSSFNVSGFKAFHDSDLIGGQANEAAFSISGNLKYNPVKQMMLGMELMTGYREVLNGTNGRFYRLQFSARYSFGYKNRAVYEKG